jgi:hypothetical protein
MGLLYPLILFSQSSWSIVPIPVLGVINPLNAELNPIVHLLALLGIHHIFHVSRIRVKPEHEADHSHLVPKLRTHGGVTPHIYFNGVMLNKAEGRIYIFVPSTLICSSRFTVVKRMHEHHNQIRSRGRFKAFRFCADVWISTMREGPLRALFFIFRVECLYFVLGLTLFYLSFVSRTTITPVPQICFCIGPRRVFILVPCPNRNGNSEIWFATYFFFYLFRTDFVKSGRNLLTFQRIVLPNVLDT